MRSPSHRPLCRFRAASGRPVGTPWGRTRAWPVALLIALVALLAGPVAQADATPRHGPSTVAVSPSDIGLSVTGLTPSYLSRGGSVSLSVAISNASTEPLNASVVRAYLSSAPFITRNSLARWEATELGERLGNPLGEAPISTVIPVGGSLSTTFSTSAVQRTGSGPYGLTVTVEDPETGDILAEQRTFLVVNPPKSVTKISLVVPLTNPDPVGTAAFAVTESGVVEPNPEVLQRARQGVRALTSGSFSSAFAVAQVPGVTWTLDPSLVLDTSVAEVKSRSTAATPAPSGTSSGASSSASSGAAPVEQSDSGGETSGQAAGGVQAANEAPAAPATTPASSTATPTTPAATTPATPSGEASPEITAKPTTRLDPSLREAIKGVHSALVAGAKNRDVYGGDYASLPLAQVRSVSSPSAINGQSLFSQVQQWSKAAWTQLGTQPRGILGTVPMESVSPTALSQWVRAGATQLLLPDATVPPLEALTYTPTGLAQVEVGNNAFTAALSDNRLSQDLDGFEAADTGVSTQQRMLADLAVISGELPQTQRSVVIEAPRDWAPQVLTTKAALGQVFSAPWVSVQPLSEVFAATSNIERAEPQAKSESRDGYFDSVAARSLVPDTGPYENATQRLSLIAKLQSMVEPQGALAPLQRLSVAAIASPASAPDDAVVKMAVESVSAAIIPAAPAKVNFVAESGNIPVTVRNTLNATVTLRLKVVPELLLLSSDRIVEVQLKPQETRSVTMPIVARANGDTAVKIEVLDATDETVTASEPFTVSVRAQWEGIVTYIVVGLIVGLLIYGFLRRRFTKKRTTLESR